MGCEISTAESNLGNPATLSIQDFLGLISDVLDSKDTVAEDVGEGEEDPTISNNMMEDINIVKEIKACGENNKGLI